MQTLNTYPKSRDLYVPVKIMNVNMTLEQDSFSCIEVEVEEWVPYDSNARVGTIRVPIREHTKLDTNTPVLVREIDVDWTGMRDLPEPPWLGTRARRALDKRRGVW